MVRRDCRGRVDAMGWALLKDWASDGVAIKEIARRLRVSPATVRRNLKQLQAPGERRPPTPPGLPRGRAAAMVLRRRRVVALVTQLAGPRGHQKPRYASCRAIARQLGLRGYATSASTVRRDLRARGYVARKRCKVPNRQVGDAARRLVFCTTPQPPGCLMLFSDEKYFDVNDHGAPWQWVLHGHSTIPRQFSRWAPAVMVWGCIGVGVKELVIFSEGTRVTAQIYKFKCLQRVLVPLLTARGWLEGGTDVHTFMQDGARVHTANAVMAYLVSKNVAVLPNWPPRSPKLNPIEHFWALIQRKVSDRGPRNRDELVRFIEECWAAFPQSEIDHLVLSWDQRLDDCAAKGGLE